MTELLTVSDAWRAAYPGAVAGLLAMRGVVNPDHADDLDGAIAAAEADFRARFADRNAVRADPRLLPYTAYYRQFGKTYHVQLQLESAALKGKAMPRGPGLVAAMFLSELSNLLLTAGHDLDAVRPPVRLDVADGTEQYVVLNGQEQTLRSGDMFMADGQGVISSVLHGPDRRTRLTADTRRVLFAVYAPPDIGADRVAAHLRDLETNVRVVAPNASVESMTVQEA